MDEAAQSLIDYLQSSTEPDVRWPKDKFEEAAIKRWAAGELLEAIMDHPLRLPSEIIEEFALTMLVYAAESTHEKSKHMFSIASGFAYEWLDTYNERRNKEHEHKLADQSLRQGRARPCQV